MIERAKPPWEWAIPGDFVDYGESLEQAAIREALEETSLDIQLIGQFYTYSDPKRDSRFHTISTVFIAKASGAPRAQHDAKEIGVCDEKEVPEILAFDHSRILKDYFSISNRKYLLYAR